MKYNPEKIERKWQKYWEAKKFYSADEKSKKPKYYQLETFPYPSAAGLHVGHPKGYIGEDIHARYMRMNGREVMYTMGWDAFGLPTENYAIKIGKSPKEVAKANIKNFKRQVKMFGLSYDWDREINTSDPSYYKWTQWIFLKMYEKGLAYRAKTFVNWCPKDKTVLANEQVKDGCCDRCGAQVEQKELYQWMFKVTDYVDRLIDDIEGLDWPETTRVAQKNWIGRSEGALIKFLVPNSKEYIEVFTTRADTLFGVTYLVLAPEHQMVTKLTRDENLNAVNKYLEEVKNKTEMERLHTDKSKTGVDTGGYVVNPINNEKIPVWVADYVIGWYGTGAVMAVPAHDERDFEFAKKFDLPVKMVVCPHYPAPTCPVLENAFTEDAHLVDSAEFTGLGSAEARRKIVEKLKEKKLAEFKKNYKLHDWVISRQRYWGVPIPMIHCEKCGYQPVTEKDLPIKLPELDEYKPAEDGRSPLARAKEWLTVKCLKCSGEAERETDTMDTFVDSSWYYLRYTDPKNNKIFASDDKLKHWMPVDLYVIGSEHAILHLLYSRFITKFLYDQGYLNFKEPFLKLRHLGLIQGTDGQKMSKSRGNVINPDEIVSEYGADTVRLYEMFMGPFEDGQPWDPQGVIGAYRFLNRVWNFIGEPEEPKTTDKGVDRILNKATKEIGDDIKNLKFNTGVSGLMKLLNAIEDKWLTKKQYGTFLKLLAPFAPHIVEELWSRLTSPKATSQSRILDLHSKSGQITKNYKSIHLQSWPEYDEALLADEPIELVIQINGIKRDVLKITKGLSEAEVRSVVLNNENIKKYLTGREVKKFIYVKDRLANIVA